jgi:hypothetical protein
MMANPDEVDDIWQAPDNQHVQSLILRYFEEV